MMSHYICTGGCQGVSKYPGVCQAPTCPKYNKPLEECDCTDGKHYGKQDRHEKNFFQRYKDYFHDNPKNLWFKRKIYGWGWVPVKLQGWLVILAFVLFLVWNALNVSNGQVPTQSELFWFVARIIVAAGVLIFICYKKGESPRWQWGFPKNGDK